MQTVTSEQTPILLLPCSLYSIDVSTNYKANPRICGAANGCSVSDCECMVCIRSEPLAFQSSAARSAARNTLVLPVLRDFAAPLFPPFPRPLEAPRVEPEPREKDAFRLEPRLSPTETQRSGQSDEAKISTG